MSTANLVGWVGALLLLVGYVQASRGRWSGSGRAFQACSIVGALGLLTAAAAAGVWSSAVLNAVWALIGVVTLARSREAAGRVTVEVSPREDPS